LRSKNNSFEIEKKTEVLADGQPFYNKKNKKLYVGDGSTQLKSLRGTEIGLDLKTDNDGAISTTSDIRIRLNESDKNTYSEIFLDASEKIVSAENGFIIPGNGRTQYDKKILNITTYPKPFSAKNSNGNIQNYIPGIYTSSLSLNNTNLEVEVTVDESHINAIRFSNLDESVTTMFPLIQPAMEEIADQICKTQSLENVALSDKTPYTSQVILNAITDALTKAEAH
jgi:uncharacterized protein with FMN-binding domain